MRVLVFLAALWVSAAAWAEDMPTMVVTGEGTAFAPPDMATITLGVTAEAETAVEAMNETSEVAAAILARLDGLGIEPRDRQTSDLGLGPIYAEQTKPGQRVKIVGFRASNRLTVRVRDLAVLGDALGAVLGDGANRLDGLSFGLQEPRPLEDAARRKAVQDALAKAQLYAEAAGVSLGPIQSITEAGNPRPQVEMFRAAPMMADAVPVAGGETGLTSRVNVVFALEQGGE
ncbi:MAG: SIMPL domain-containing protein [Paracoccaceae bacterium]|nr:SIMPL domain-containing protein [Paracoccaceae bacterium]